MVCPVPQLGMPAEVGTHRNAEETHCKGGSLEDPRPCLSFPVRMRRKPLQDVTLQHQKPEHWEAGDTFFPSEGKMCRSGTPLLRFLPDCCSICLLEGHKYNPGEF